MNRSQIFRSMSTVWVLWALAIWLGWVPSMAHHVAYEPLFQVLMAIFTRLAAMDTAQRDN